MFDISIRNPALTPTSVPRTDLQAGDPKHLEILSPYRGISWKPLISSPSSLMVMGSDLDL